MTLKNPILLDLPMPIKTKRLVICPMMPGDGQEVFKAIDESRDLFSLWLPWVGDVKTWEDSEITAHEFYAGFIQRKNMNLVIKYNQQIIGMCGFNTLNWHISSGSIGYWCLKSEQGKGYIKEAVAALTIYAFKIMNLKRISILCDDENIKSIRVAKSLGYTLETRAKGLLENLRGKDLTYARRYVRFDPSGLEDFTYAPLKGDIKLT